jgi:hypothetical protein
VLTKILFGSNLLHAAKLHIIYNKTKYSAEKGEKCFGAIHDRGDATDRKIIGRHHRNDPPDRCLS